MTWDETPREIVNTLVNLRASGRLVKGPPMAWVNSVIWIHSDIPTGQGPVLCVGPYNRLTLFCLGGCCCCCWGV
jgi:hypothetical protein